jgi:hypothetical protein
MYAGVSENRCLERDEYPLESTEQRTCVRGLCLEFAFRYGLDDPSEQLRRVARGAVVHASEFGTSACWTHVCGDAKQELLERKS